MVFALLDSVSEAANDMDLAGINDFNICMIFLYNFLGAFILFNTLIGFSCQVATEALAEDENARKTSFLEVNLIRLLDAYDQEGDGRMSHSEFEILLTDPEMHELLEAFGTTLDNVHAVTDVLFDDNETISFQEILDTVMQLRESDAARVTHLIGMRQYMGGRLDQLEAFVQGKRGRTSSSCARRTERGKQTSLAEQWNSMDHKLSIIIDCLAQSARQETTAAAKKEAVMDEAGVDAAGGVRKCSSHRASTSSGGAHRASSVGAHRASRTSLHKPAPVPVEF